MEPVAISVDVILFAVPLAVGWLLDLLLADPRWLPHPIRWFGQAIFKGDKLLNMGTARHIKGAALAILLVVGCWVVLYFCMGLIRQNQWFYYPIASVMVFYGLANRSLINEVIKVDIALARGGVVAGREQLSQIVGRETAHLTQNQIRTAALETLAENLSDGVVAPLFYYAIGGIPLMFAYKMINTLDSIIGYKSPRYKRFGCFAARLDDVANFIPARITAMLMVAVTLSKRGLQFVFKYGHKHSSPNSGYPEAALAGILNCRFGGPNTYHGQLVEKPYIGENHKKIHSADMYRATSINHRVTILLLVIAFALNYAYSIM